MSDRPQTLQNEYRLRFTRTRQYRNAVWKVLCDHYFNRFIPAEAHVLDLGSGWGEFINHINAAQKYAMDLNPDTKHQLTPGTHFLHQDCSQTWDLEPEVLDTVFSSNFIEHLPDKFHVERTVAEAFRCLKPQGRFILLGPNIKYVPGAYWDFWDHFIPITERSLCEMLKIKGFDIQLCMGRFLPYSMSTGRTPPLFLVRWYLNLPIIWPLFGKQFLVIGHKAGRARPLAI